MADNWERIKAQLARQRRRQVPCNSCLTQLVIPKLHDYVEERPILIQANDAMAACWEISRELRAAIRQGNISPHRIHFIIHKLRLKYVNFRKFLKLDGVTYDEDTNLVYAGDDYVRNNQHMESREKKKFREEGLADYEYIHYIFRKKRFPMFEDEPTAAFVDPNIYSDSSDSSDEE